MLGFGNADLKWPHLADGVGPTTLPGRCVVPVRRLSASLHRSLVAGGFTRRTVTETRS
jgi:hypothetical protein